MVICVYLSQFMCIKNIDMRTNIVIDSELITRAISLSHNKTKKAVVEEALKLLVKFKEQLKITELRGNLNWEGNLDQMRLDS